MTNTTEDKKKYFSIRFHTMGETTIKKNGKTFRSITSMISHINRTEKMDPGYLLREEFKHLNIYEDYLGDLENLEQHKARIAAEYYDLNKRKMPSNAKPYLDGLITFSAKMQEDIHTWGREELFKAIKGFLEVEFGPTQGEDQAVLNLALHMDETTPHFHFTAMNWDRRVGRTYGSAYARELEDPNNPTRHSSLQDRLEDWLKNWGGFQNQNQPWDYARGENTNIKTYHTKRHAQQEHLKTLAETKEKHEELIQQHEATIEGFEVEVEALQKKLEDLEAQYANEVEEKSRLIEDIEQLKVFQAEKAEEILIWFRTIPKLQGPMTAIQFIIKSLDQKFREEREDLVKVVEAMAKGKKGKTINQ